MSIGQLSLPSYDCFDTAEAKSNWLLTMVNKGKQEEERLGHEALAGLMEHCIEQGYVSTNGNGPQPTAAGIEFIKEYKASRKKAAAQAA